MSRSLPKLVVDTAAFALERIVFACFLLAVLALFAMTASYLIEVVARYILRSPTTWGSEMVGYTLLVSVFMALPMLTLTGRHVAVTLLPDTLRQAARSLLFRLVDLVGMISCLAVAWICHQEALRQFRRGIMTLANNPIPKWWLMAVIALGLFLSGLCFLQRLFARDNLAVRRIPGVEA